jgi:hypothetical protein
LVMISTIVPWMFNDEKTDSRIWLHITESYYANNRHLC